MNNALVRCLASMVQNHSNGFVCGKSSMHIHHLAQQYIKGFNTNGSQPGRLQLQSC